MKFFHLSDLHIGLKLMNRDLREEQMDILRQVTDLAREEQPDAVVIAGDIYDKAVPAAEAVEVFDSFITELKRAVPEAEMMLISGNHDSGLRLNCFREILDEQKVHMIGLPPRREEEYIEKVTFQDEFGPVNFYLLPFVKPSMVKQIVGVDENGMHLLFNLTGSKTADDLHLSETGTAIIKGAQGAVGIKTISTFTAGFILVMVTLFVVLNLVRSRQGRAIMAIRDNEIAAQSIGLHITSYKLMAFVTSAALAGAAGALYGLNYSSLQATKFNFNTSILILVFVVLGGLGNIWGSLVAAAALTILPEALRGMDDLRMLIYSIVLILVMLATNAPSMKAFFSRVQAAFGKKSHEGGKGNAV